MTDPFYARFEARFRGGQEEISRRQALWLPVLESLQGAVNSRVLLDLGCGRGEWLALAGKAGWQPEGVEIDPGMAEIAAGRGLRVWQRDCLAELRERPDNSIAVVSAFHLAEHLPFPVLLEIFRQIFRTLEPGGLLLLETPNPESLPVGTCTFHLDPTHHKPLPPELLRFLASESGFDRAAVIRLHEDPDFNPSAISLSGVLYGVSPDYALIAQKGTPAAFPWPPDFAGGCSLFEAAAAFDYSLHRHFDWLIKSREEEGLLLREAAEQQGLQLREIGELIAWNKEEALATQAGLDALFAQAQTLATQTALDAYGAHVQTALDALAAQVRTLAPQAALDALAAQARTLAPQAALDALAAQVRTLAPQAVLDAYGAHVQTALEALTARLETVEACRGELRAVYASRSWRLSAPLRSLGASARWFRQGAKAWLSLAPASRPQRLLLSLHRRLQEHPALKALLLRILAHFPAVKRRLASLTGPAPEAEGFCNPVSPDLASGAESEPDAVRFSLTARKIYRNLKEAMARRKES
jgi:O-antigen chain-terminating methyltransferase